MPITNGAGPALVRPYSMSFKSFGKRVSVASKNMNNAFHIDNIKFNSNEESRRKSAQKIADSMKAQGINTQEGAKQAINDSVKLIGCIWVAALSTVAACVAE